MDRRAFIAAMVAAPIVPIAVKLAPPVDPLIAAMDAAWRKCIRGAPKNDWVVVQEIDAIDLSRWTHPYWDRT